MIDRHVVAFHEAHAEQARGHVELRLDHIVQLQISLHLALIEIEAFSAHLFSVIAPIPRLQFVIEPGGRDARFDIGGFLQRAFARRPPDLLHQADRRIRRAGHGAGGAVMGEGLVAEKIGHLQAQGEDLADRLFVVVGVFIVAAHRPGAPRGLALFAIGRGLQEGLHAGARQRDHMAVHVAIGRRARGRRHDEAGQFGDIVFGQGQRPGFPVGLLVLSKAGVHASQRRADLRKAFAVRALKLGAGALEIVMGHFQQARLLVGEFEIFAVFKQRVDAREQVRVQRDGGAVGGQARVHLPLNGADFVIGGRTRQIAEHPPDTAEVRTGVLHRQQRVLKGRRVRVGGDRVDLRIVRGHGGFEGGNEVLRLDLVEGRRAERRIPFSQQRIDGLRLGRSGLLHWRFSRRGGLDRHGVDRARGFILRRLVCAVCARSAASSEHERGRRRAKHQMGSHVRFSPTTGLRSAFGSTARSA